MNNTFPRHRFPKTFNLPYQLGVYLAVNAVADACLVVDGPNCVMPKVDFLAGNHDLYSTLLSADGRHRVLCTMSAPLPQRQDPEKKLTDILLGVAEQKEFAVILLTSLPFLKMAGMDYEGIASGLTARVPVVDVPVPHNEADWLDGYAQALAALARALPDRKVKRRKRSVALVGYLMDRNESDHSANIAELRRLLELCGLGLACVFPSGGSFGALSGALEADVVVSLPYGRAAAAAIAARSGAKLVETGLPMGIGGTCRWLESVRAAAGMKEGLPPAVAALAKRTAAAMAPALHALAHQNVTYAGDPCLFAAFASLAPELGMRINCALIDSLARPLGTGRLPRELLFAPDTAEALSIVRELSGYSRTDIVVGNSFTVTESLDMKRPYVELGFPSYGHHCLVDEPFLGFAGAVSLTGRLLNSLLSR
ncbi:MAG: nitrogenase component 1 [Elusimicrobiota bacterium]